MSRPKASLTLVVIDNGGGAIFDALPIVLVHSLLGAGATRWVAGAQIVQQYVVMLPLAWLFAFPLGLGVFGLWLGIAGSRIALAVAAIPRFQGRSWETIDV